MKKSIFVLSAAVLSLSMFSIELATTADAAPRKKKITVQQQPATGAQSKRPGIVVPLSEAECKGLGGKVLDTLNSCEGTLRACYTTDAAGVIHKSCITS
jgi:hypothetical protein